MVAVPQVDIFMLEAAQNHSTRNAIVLDSIRANDVEVNYEPRSVLKISGFP